MTTLRPFTFSSPSQYSRPSARRITALVLSIASLTLANLSTQPVALASESRTGVNAASTEAIAHTVAPSASFSRQPSRPSSTVLSPEDDCSPIASGSAVSETIAFLGDTACFSFAAHQGDMISVYMINQTTAGQRRLTLSLRNADGQTLTTASSNFTGGNAEKRQFVLPADGDYFILTSGVVDTIGPYVLWYSNLSLNTAAISDGQSLRRGIDYPGDGEVFTFSGRAGERMTLFVGNLMITGTRRLAVSVYKPSGPRWLYYTSSLAGWNVEIRGSALPEAGAYVVVVEGAGDSTGEYQIGYSNIGQDLTVVKDGQTFGQSISFAGDEDAFAFMGCGGDIVTIFGDNMTTSGDRKLSLTLTRPDGTSMAPQSSIMAGSDVQLKDMTLTASGQYRIIFGGVKDTTGPYTGTISYVDLPPTCGTMAQPDRYEVNDTCLAATHLATYTLPAWSANLHAANDLDYYSMVITRPGTTIQATLNQPDQDYDLALYDVCTGSPLPVAEGHTRQNGHDSLVYNIGASSATTYYLKVEGFEGAFAELPYDLQIELSGDSLEPNDTCSAASVVSSTLPASSFLSYAGDTDFFKVYLGQPYMTLHARLQQLDRDYDLALFNGCATSGGTPRHVGQTRQIGEERLNYNVGAAPGWYYIKVNGLDGASSTYPYTLSVTYDNLGAQEYGSLIVTHRSRLQARYGAPAEQTLYGKLTALALQPTVAGLVYDLGTNTPVVNAYAAWDTNPTSVPLANAVAQAIKTAIRDQLTLYPGIRYLVLSGDDRVIPFYRTPVRPDTTNPNSAWVSEAMYLGQFGSPWGATDPTAEALRNDYTLTDDYYASDDGVPARGHTVYVPSRAVGRLVETPAEMGAVIDAFTAVGGPRSTHTALSAGAYALSDVAQSACNLFGAVGLTTTCKVGDTWDANSLRLVWLTTAQVKDVVGIHTAANHAAFTAPAGGAITAVDAVNATASLSGTLLYSLGSHTGLNVAPGNPNETDWPQALAGRGASLVGSTGWGYGLAQGVGLSEAMVKLFADALVAGDGSPLGDALLSAKRAYYLGATRFDHFDEKALATLTLYGLPMYSMAPGGATVLSSDMLGKSEPEQAAALSAQWAGIAENDDEIDVSVEQKQLRFSALQTQTTTFGRYYTLDGQAGAQDGQPIQPRHIASTYAISNPIHGAVLVNATYTDVVGVNPVIAAAINPSSTVITEPSFQSATWTPATLLSVQRAPGMFDGGTSQKFVIDVGQYKGTSATGTQRLYSDMTAWLYRSDSPDWTPPSLTCILASVATTGTVMHVTASDSAGIYGVMVAYTTGNGQWQSVDLNPSAGGAWSGIIPGTAPAMVVQVADKAGNVTSRAIAGSTSSRSTCAIYMPRATR